MVDRLRIPREFAAQAQLVPLLALAASIGPACVADTWQPQIKAGTPSHQQQHAFGYPMSEAILEPGKYFARSISEFPRVGRPELTPPRRHSLHQEPTAEIDDLLDTIRAGQSIARPATMHALASRVATKAASERNNPLSDQDVQEWARKLAEEAASLTD